MIHPKTIQPLKKKKIPLRVRSFKEHKNKGSQIAEDVLTFPEVPSFFIKENQILISISDRSLSFIVETHMSKIFGLLAKHSVSVNVMQNSAVSFSVCVDDDKYKIPQLISDLQKDFEVYYNKNLTLYTVRNYTKDVVNDFFNGKRFYWNRDLEIHFNWL